jgi:peptide/nickel transport system substrate-binding protein
VLKNLWALLLAVPIILAVFSCTKPEPASEIGSQNENVLRIDVQVPFDALDPVIGSESSSSHVFGLLFSYLFVPDEEGQLEPDLAIRWDYDAAGFTWTIRLRDDARFHDGHPVTSGDVKYSLEYCLKSGLPSVFGLIDRVTLLTDTSLFIKLKRNDPDFPMKIWDIEIVPHHGETAPGFRDHPIGSGPFRFKSREGKRAVNLTAYDGYYGGRPSLDGVVFTYEPDTEKSWARLLLGKTDIGVGLSFKDYQMLKPYHERFYFNEIVTEYYTILLFNTADPLFTDPDVRLALACAVDKQAIVDRVFHGAARAAIGPAGINSPYRNPDLKPIPYNPGRALELLRQAGWAFSSEDHFLYRNGKSFELTILIPDGHQTTRLVAEYLQLFLNEVGIKAHLHCLPQNELLRKYAYNNEFQAVLTQFWASSRSPETIELIWSGINEQKAAAGLFDHPQVAALLQEAAQAEDPDRRKKLFHELDALVASLQPGLFLFHEMRFEAMSKRFRLPHRFSFDLSGIYRLREASLSPR